MSKQFFYDAIDGKTDRIPLGLWFHYISIAETKPYSPELLERAYQGYLKYATEANLDFVKVMPDMFFIPKNLWGIDVTDEMQLYAVESVGTQDQVYGDQFELIKRLSDTLGDRTAVYATVLAPYYHLMFANMGRDKKPTDPMVFAEAIRKYPAAMKHAADELAKDIAEQAKRFILEAGAAGIFIGYHYLDGVTYEEFDAVFGDAERYILDEIAKVNQYTILHVCGGATRKIKNAFDHYKDMPFRILNYSVEHEGISLAEMKKKFPDKVICGGFNNRAPAVIHSGTKEEIQEATKKIIDEAGRDRLMLGPDCSLITKMMTNEKVAWVKEIADTYKG